MRRPSDVLVEVIANREIAPGYFSLRLGGASALGRFRPGQFLMLGWVEGLDPFLPRAMSIRGAWPARQRSEVRAVKCEVEILYKVYGRGTAFLSGMRPGRMLRALGPLGNAFEVSRAATRLLLVAGGIGIPPIVALAETLASRKTSRRRKIVVYVGGKSRADLLCIPDLRRSGATVHLVTEDGSAGFKGLVTELLAEDLSRSSSSSGTVLYACGPVPMLASLAVIAEKHDLPYQASLEANMACGFGACMGCVVPVVGGEGHQTYRLVCSNGPVFDGRHILWT